MLSLKAKIRKIQGKKVKALRKKGILPAVLYGPKIKTENIEVNLKEFQKVFTEAGESTLISLETDKDKYLVLIHEIKYNALTSEPIHTDFYQPSLTEEVEVRVPIILDGEAPAVRTLGGTLIKNISEIEVKALPQNLPKEIKVNVEGLESFEDSILIKDLKLSKDVKISRNPEEIVAHVAPPEKVEEELEKPIEEKVEDIERVEEKKEKEAGAEEKTEEAKPEEKKEKKEEKQ